MKNIFTYFILIISLIFGVVFYDLISVAGFTYIDELISALLLMECLRRKKFKREFCAFFFIVLLFLFSSLATHINTTPAIITDFFIIIKPFIAFYSVYFMGLQLTNSQKKTIRRIIMIMVYIIIFGVIIDYELFVWTIPSHASRFATMIVVFAFTYYYCSERDRRSLIYTLLILSISLLSLRSKAFGFFTIAFFLLYFLRTKTFSLSIANLISAIIVIALVILVSWEKISFYFIEGTDRDNVENFMARPALYVGAYKILCDYPIMGSGMGTYASFASSEYYSPLYNQYNLDRVHGLEEGGSFISDTFFPALAQYGIAGIFFFFYFFYMRYKEIVYNKRNTGNLQWFKMTSLFLIFFFIESISDSTLVQNRGVVMMMLLAMYIIDGRKKIEIVKV